VQTRDPPEELKENYSEEHLAKTRAYSLDKKDFGLVKGAFDFVESFALLWFCILPIAWKICEVVAGKLRDGWQDNEYVVSIVFVLLATIVGTVEGLPWSWYYTFVIEEKHGFNKQTLPIFVTDTIKSVRPSAPSHYYTS
jgi:STE24 endopeptidase